MMDNAHLKQGEKGIWTSIIVYCCLSLLKISLGSYYQSEALFADGLNNSTDIIASIAVLIGIKISRKPPDEDHAYGHSRAETIAALIASLIMAAVGLQVLYQAVLSTMSDEVAVPHLMSAWVSLVCAVIMYGVYRMNRRLAKATGSMAMEAAAQDNRSDALVSIGAFVGIMGSQFGLPWLDPIAAFVVGIIICKTAWDIFRNTTHSLSDGFDQSKLEAYKETIGNTPGVQLVKDIKARIHGNHVWVDVIVAVNNDLNVVESHEISEQIENRLHKKYKIAYTHVHIEPLDSV
ncbi:cation diffusion facilitator family transporter [Paenibacillus sp. N1-5-1-14]|uniref:cation diffusion facilitator family transporter n=1 Tax=Paenibacillus radicibacter TaxID=2972488 RepID=UPI002158A5BC|nr:cation diffusion facilitator family transporter [Paenibacillus radicibacter]MCR8642081.1 cation diffusion facilitator family transporter [Paenibacillus radicibacter]